MKTKKEYPGSSISFLDYLESQEDNNSSQYGVIYK